MHRVFPAFALAGSVLLLPGQSCAQNLQAAFQRLPLTRVVPCGLVQPDTVTGAALALKRKVVPAVSRIIEARKGWFVGDEDTLIIPGFRLFRASVEPCDYHLLVLYGITTGYLLTTTPDFKVIDAFEVWVWEMPAGRLGKHGLRNLRDLQTMKLYGTELTGSILDCASFTTTQTSREFYQSNRKPTVLSQKNTHYRITTAGVIEPVEEVK